MVQEAVVARMKDDGLAVASLDDGLWVLVRPFAASADDDDNGSDAEAGAEEVLLDDPAAAIHRYGLQPGTGAAVVVAMAQVDCLDALVLLFMEVTPPTHPTPVATIRPNSD